MSSLFSEKKSNLICPKHVLLHCLKCKLLELTSLAGLLGLKGFGLSLDDFGSRIGGS